MRMLAKTLEYLLVTGVALGLAYEVILPATRATTDAMNRTAALIEDPASAVSSR